MRRACTEGASARLGDNHTLNISYSIHIGFPLGPKFLLMCDRRILQGFVLRGSFRSEAVREAL